MHRMASGSVLALLAGDLPEGIDSDRAQQIILGLLGLCVVAAVFAVRTIQKATTRVIMVLVLIAVGAGLWLQREALQDCAGECSCHLFGQDVKVPDPQGGCPQFGG